MFPVYLHWQIAFTSKCRRIADLVGPVFVIINKKCSFDFRKVSGVSDRILRKLCYGIVHQESAQDSGEGDEIAMDARSRCRIIRGRGHSKSTDKILVNRNSEFYPYRTGLSVIHRGELVSVTPIKLELGKKKSYEGLSSQQRIPAPQEDHKRIHSPSLGKM